MAVVPDPLASIQPHQLHPVPRGLSGLGGRRCGFPGAGDLARWNARPRMGLTARVIMNELAGDRPGSHRHSARMASRFDS
jgi:hypothetical protein